MGDVAATKRRTGTGPGLAAPPGRVGPRVSPSGRATAYLTPEDRVDVGRQARAAVKRSAHGGWTPAAGRDPLGILEEQARGREQSLIPIRYGRMAASPFAFYREPRRSWPPTWPVRPAPA